VAAGQGVFPTGCKGHAAHRPGVSGQHRERLAGLDIPLPDDAVFGEFLAAYKVHVAAAGQDGPAVGREGHGIDLFRIAFEPTALVRVPDVPETDDLVRPTGEGVAAIG